MSGKRDLTKAQRGELRRIAALAYERELAKALTALEEQFRRWRAAEIGTHDLNDLIHAFHQGPHRELWSRYTHGPVDFVALYALRGGIVSHGEVQPAVLELLGPRREADE